MTVLKYILLYYSLFGILITGGILFNRTNKTNIFLALFTFVFTIGQLNFIYDSTAIIDAYPQFAMLTYATVLLYGPCLWYHLKYINQPDNISFEKWRWHLIPFLIYVIFTVFLFTYPGTERLSFVRTNFYKILMPLNYCITFQILSYGVIMALFAKNEITTWSSDKKLYVKTIVVIYILTAVLQSFLTIFAETYQWFVYYYLFTSSIVFFVGYILYFKPQLFIQISKKYSSSRLLAQEMKIIINKIDSYLQIDENLTNRHLNLAIICQQINEKKHHVSQSISEELNSTFKDILNKKRIDFAKILLMDSSNDQMKIFAIAIDSGFSNKSTFNRAFLKFAACTPSEFRKNRLK